MWCFFFFLPHDLTQQTILKIPTFSSLLRISFSFKWKIFSLTTFSFQRNYSPLGQVASKSFKKKNKKKLKMIWGWSETQVIHSPSSGLHGSVSFFLNSATESLSVLAGSHMHAARTLFWALSGRTITLSYIVWGLLIRICLTEINLFNCNPSSH